MSRISSLLFHTVCFSIGVAFSSAKGIDVEWCKVPEIGLLAPDLILHLDIPPEMMGSSQ